MPRKTGSVVPRGELGLGRAPKCKCPNCGFVRKHVRKKSCSKQECPECGTHMVATWD